MFEYYGKYKDNYDGDTIRFDIDLGLGVWIKNQPIRLYGVDTPEMRGNTITKARKAKNFVSERIKESSRIKLHTYKDRKGKYGRWLADVYLLNEHEQWECLNEVLVKQGHAVRANY